MITQEFDILHYWVVCCFFCSLTVLDIILLLLLYGCQVGFDSLRPHGLCQASLSFTISRSLPKFISIDSVMPSNHLLTLFTHFMIIFISTNAPILPLRNRSIFCIGRAWINWCQCNLTSVVIIVCVCRCFFHSLIYSLTIVFWVLPRHWGNRHERTSLETVPISVDKKQGSSQVHKEFECRVMG